jgi:MFS family permease
MATRGEIGAVYAGAVVQGIVLVAFPAVSSIFTSPDHYALTETEYGGMFVPQAITAILASLLGAGLARKLGGKRVLLIGLAADFTSMALLFLSQFAVDTPYAYAQHVHRRVLSGEGRPGDPHAQRAARTRHRAGADLRDDLCRPGLLVGTAAADGRSVGAADSLRISLAAA